MKFLHSTKETENTITKIFYGEPFWVRKSAVVLTSPDVKEEKHSLYDLLHLAPKKGKISNQSSLNPPTPLEAAKSESFLFTLS